MNANIPVRLFSLMVASVLVLLATATVAPAPAAAQTRTALTLRAGSPGVGGDVAVNLASHWNVRVGASYFSNSQLTEQTLEDVSFGLDWTATLFNVSAIADYFPWKSSGFRLSAGVLYNGNGAEASLSANEPYEVGSRTFTAEELGGLDGEVSFSPLAPYVGLGFGNATALGSRLGFVVDLGGMYHQAPRVDLNGAGMLSPNADQAPQIEENLKSFQFFPVLSLGVSYRMTGR